MSHWRRAAVFLRARSIRRSSGSPPSSHPVFTFNLFVLFSYFIKWDLSDVGMGCLPFSVKSGVETKKKALKSDTGKRHQGCSPPHLLCSLERRDRKFEKKKRPQAAESGARPPFLARILCFFPATSSRHPCLGALTVPPYLLHRELTVATPAPVTLRPNRVGRSFSRLDGREEGRVVLGLLVYQFLPYVLRYLRTCLPRKNVARPRLSSSIITTSNQHQHNTNTNLPLTFFLTHNSNIFAQRFTSPYVQTTEAIWSPHIESPLTQLARPRCLLHVKLVSTLRKLSTGTFDTS